MSKTQELVKLRDYQIEAINAVISAKSKGLTKMGLLLPTGTGKSIIQAALIKELMGTDQVAFIVPFDHLIDNALKNLHLMFSSDEIGIVKAKHNDFERKINIVSIQTALRENRMADLKGRYKLVVVDEMHLFLATKFMAALNELIADDGICVGFSATILREDRKSLAKVFGQLVYHKTLWEMIAKGWLAPLKGIQLNAKIDFSKIKQTAGDYDDGELASILSTNECMELLYQGWKDNAGDRVTIAFTPTIDMAVKCADFWKRRGIAADWVCGAGSVLPQKEMEEKIRKFTSGETQILFNSAKLIVGFDHPPISAVYIIRPTKSQSYYVQMSGRGTRLCNDTVYKQSTIPIADYVSGSKTDCLILDVGGVSDLGLVQFPELFDLPDHVEKEIKERIKKNPDETWGTEELFKEHKELFSASGIIASNINLVGESKYSWAKTSWGWNLSLGDKGEMKIETKDTGFTVRSISKTKVDKSVFLAYNSKDESKYDLTGITSVVKKANVDKEDGFEYIKTTNKLIQSEPIQLEWAMVLAEDYVRLTVKEDKSIATLVDKSAKWRQNPLSEKQFYLLTKHLTNHPEVLSMLRYKTYNDYIYQSNRDTQMTKGRATELFNEVTEKWNKAKASKNIKVTKADSKY